MNSQGYLDRLVLAGVTFLLFLVSVAILETLFRRSEPKGTDSRTFPEVRYPEWSGERPDIAEAAVGDPHNLGKALERFGRGSYPEREARPVKTPGASPATSKTEQAVGRRKSG
jgi:hypothetical protein